MAKKIGQILMEQGLLTKAQLQTAQRTQEFFGGRLGSIFIELGFLKEQALGDALSQASGAPYAPPEYLEGVPMEVTQLIPADMADKHKIIPLRVEHGRLHLGMLRPKDLRATNEVSSTTGLAVVAYVVPEFRILEGLERYYSVKRRRARGISVETPTEDVDLAGLSAAQGATSLPRATQPIAKRRELGLDGLPMDAEFGMHGNSSPTPYTRQKTEDLLERMPQDPKAWRRATPQRTAPAVRSSPSVGTAGPDSPGTDSNPLEHSARRLLQAQARDEIAEILLQVTERFFRRRLLFIVQRDRIVGWDGTGAGVSREDVKRVLLPMDSLSLFTAVKAGSKPMVGPVADVPANRRLFHELRMGFPAEVALLPIRIRDRVVAILYGDNATQPVASVDVDLLQRFTLQAAVALEILILRSKLLSF